jgi:predicted NACHT family NTPase
LPFTRPQIETFIEKWYQLRPEWLHQRERGIKDFLGALHDAQRPHLLSLARRPIFLALMALVHCTRNEMPHGRAALYEAIIDLYLGGVAVGVAIAALVR